MSQDVSARQDRCRAADGHFSMAISGYIAVYGGDDVGETSQKRAPKNYRDRLRDRGLARFEVLGLDKDRDLIRSLARHLAEGPDADKVRTTVSRTISGEPPRTGGILDALRRSPLVGADLDLSRPRESGRKAEL